MTILFIYEEMPFSNMRQGLDRNLIKMLMVLTPLLLILLSLSGCIQTQLFRDMFFEEDEEPTVWGVTEVLNMQHEFTGSYPVIEYPDQQNFKVKEQALWLIISVEVEFIIVQPIPGLEQFGFDLKAKRWVDLIITDPDDVVATYKFENSVTVNLDPILDPEPGLWKVRVNAHGRGFSPQPGIEYYDHFSVTGRLNQPVDQ